MPIGSAEKIVAELAALQQTASVAQMQENTVTLTTSSLIKGQLSAVCEALALRATITRTRRGEIALGDDIAEAQWLVY